MRRAEFFRHGAAASRILTHWLLALRWQRLSAFQKLGALLMRHLGGILSDCHETVPFRNVDAIIGNIRAMLRWGRDVSSPARPTGNPAGGQAGLSGAAQTSRRSTAAADRAAICAAPGG